MNVAIFDLDGCLCDDRHRRHMLPPERGERDEHYDAYHALSWQDRPINLGVLRKHVDSEHHIVFITGRGEAWKNVALDWLTEHVGELPSFTLLMRPKHNRQPSPVLKVALFEEWAKSTSGVQGWNNVVAAYDDRHDVLAAYRQQGVSTTKLLTFPPGAPEILRGASATYEERNKQYGDNFRNVAPVMQVLFPRGIPAELLHSSKWHLFELKIVKLTRFANSGLTHLDSIHDDMVYSAMIESIMREEDS